MGSGPVPSVRSIPIVTPDRGYQALIGPNLLEQIGSSVLDCLRTLKLGQPTATNWHNTRCAVISDTTVAELFGGRVQESLESSGFRPTLITVAAGEQSKTLERAGGICDQMAAAGLDRQSFVIGLGGGMIGDLSGFVAAIFERGIPHVQIPTTLLAMVDSSIGGKTGVNTTAAKNALGAFHHPFLVVDDLDVLQTLPARELNQGFAEVIKHAIIADAGMFEELKTFATNRASVLQSPSLIGRNIKIKARLVAKDEFDRTGERALLNFGHTIGHAIERAGNYRTYLHGEAISLGMIAAAFVSAKRAGLSSDDQASILDLLQRYDLPTKLHLGFPRPAIFDALKFDKKFERGEIRFVVTPKIGSAQLSANVRMDDIREAIAAL
jgi:3-dehydroquinate synthase